MFAVAILKLAYPERFELPLAVLETVVLPLTLRIHKLVPHDRIELPMPDYKTGVMPFN